MPANSKPFGLNHALRLCTVTIRLIPCSCTCTRRYRCRERGNNHESQGGNEYKQPQKRDKGTPSDPTNDLHSGTRSDASDEQGYDEGHNRHANGVHPKSADRFYQTDQFQEWRRGVEQNNQTSDNSEDERCKNTFS